MRAIAFWSAILGYAWLAIIIVWGGAVWPGYSHAEQFISELGATGAPNGRLFSLGGFLPVGILLTVFALSSALLAPRSIARVIGFLGLALFAAGYTVAAFFPCDFGCPAGVQSASQMVHSVAGLFGYLAGPLGLILLGVAARRWPGATWLFPLGVACGVVAIIAFLSFGSGLPGLAQRVLEGSVALWSLAFAATLRRRA